MLASVRLLLSVTADVTRGDLARSGSATVYVSGTLPAGASQHQFLGVYDRRKGELVHGREVYLKRDDSGRAMLAMLARMAPMADHPTACT